MYKQKQLIITQFKKYTMFDGTEYYLIKNAEKKLNLLFLLGAQNSAALRKKIVLNFFLLFITCNRLQIFRSMIGVTERLSSTMLVDIPN